MFKVGDRVVYKYKGCTEPKMVGEIGVVIRIVNDSGWGYRNQHEQQFVIVSWENPERIKRYTWPNSSETYLGVSVLELVTPKEPDWRI